MLLFALAIEGGATELKSPLNILFIDESMVAGLKSTVLSYLQHTLHLLHYVIPAICEVIIVN